VGAEVGSTVLELVGAGTTVGAGLGVTHTQCVGVELGVGGTLWVDGGVEPQGPLWQVGRVDEGGARGVAGVEPCDVGVDDDVGVVREGGGVVTGTEVGTSEKVTIDTGWRSQTIRSFRIVPSLKYRTSTYPATTLRSARTSVGMLVPLPGIIPRVS